MVKKGRGSVKESEDKTPTGDAGEVGRSFAKRKKMKDCRFGNQIGRGPDRPARAVR